jgi:excisionase family DNA binding protein
MTSRDYVTVAHAAKRLGVCTETIRRWIRAGDLAAIRPGHHFRILRTSVENKYSTNTTTATSHRVH